MYVASHSFLPSPLLTNATDPVPTRISSLYYPFILLPVAFLLALVSFHLIILSLNSAPNPFGCCDVASAILAEPWLLELYKSPPPLA